VLDEFEQIAQIMAPLAEKAEGAFALKNDAAVFSHGAGQMSVVTTDTLIAGVHFFETDAPQDIAHKLMAVNLSDLAAMGARPRYYTLNTSYPQQITTDWIKRFASGLKAQQERYNITLLGGDTTCTPGPLTLSLTAFGEVGQGKALPRSGAKAGDLLCVSGTIGDSALGLLVARGLLEDPTDTLRARYLRPTARVALGQALVGTAVTCLDISDGLVTDFGHMQVGADIQIENIPLSPGARQALTQDSSLLSIILNGGDDYELLFCIPSDKQEDLDTIAQKYDSDIHIIGRITDKKETRLLYKDGTQLTDFQKGYRHF
jgi:thiamine-monophosphate kinase